MSLVPPLQALLWAEDSGFDGRAAVSWGDGGLEGKLTESGRGSASPPHLRRCLLSGQPSFEDSGLLRHRLGIFPKSREEEGGVYCIWRGKGGATCQ